MSKNENQNEPVKERSESTGADAVLPKQVGGHTGKLPDDMVREWIKDAEKFKELWLDSQNFDIQLPYLVDLGWEEPFIGSLSRRVLKTKVPSIPTAGVRVVQGMIELLWNPIFFKHELKKVSDAHPKGVLKHEIFHVVFEHITTRRQLPHVLWNAATDCAINSLIPRNELPAFGLIPGEMYIPPNPPPDWKPSVIAQIIKTLPKEKSSEWYMAAFLQDQRVQDAIEKAKQKCGGAGQSMPGKAGNGQKGEKQDGGDEDGQGDQDGGDDQQANGQKSFEKELEKELYGGNGGHMDDHSTWDELSDAERDMMRDYLRDIFRDCVREAESSNNGWGTIPESMKQHLKKLISKEVDWRELLSQFIGRARSTTTTSSIKRLNRRMPWDFPGRKRSYSARPALGLDQSGSMSNEWIELLFAEIGNLGNLTEYDVIPFDYTVDEANIQNIKRGMQPNTLRTRSGGTSFDAPIEYVNKHKERYDALILLTDGGCGSPKKCELPLAYILAPGCELMFKPPEGVTVIKMQDPKRK